jgi:hypothetical protein
MSPMMFFMNTVEPAPINAMRGFADMTVRSHSEGDFYDFRQASPAKPQDSIWFASKASGILRLSSKTSGAQFVSKGIAKGGGAFVKALFKGRIET